MRYHIAYNGSVVAQRKNKPLPALYDTERFGILNEFYHKESAILMRDIIEDNFPIAFLCQKS